MFLWKIAFAIVCLECTAETTLSTSLGCQNFNLSLTQKIDGEGFHREINWLLERSQHSFQCRIAIKLDVGVEMFINPDQIADINRLGQLSVLIDGEVDVEVPAQLAKKHSFYVFVSSPNEKDSFTVPFHLRYQRAQISGGFGKIMLHKPSILAICPQTCGPAEVKAPCDVSGGAQCQWSNVSYQALFDEMELLVPVGDLDDYPMVSIITLLLGCAGCIYTLFGINFCWVGTVVAYIGSPGAFCNAHLTAVIDKCQNYTMTFILKAMDAILMKSLALVLVEKSEIALKSRNLVRRF